ncbi:MAG TPA: flagellin [Microthrixaceae bacterium]|nr:flagellin [Microthrixaceae bacterium]
MRINQNIQAFNAYRNLSTTNTAMGKSLEKLSSGFRINRAADDAAGLVISQGLRAQVSGLRQATRNAQDGISVVQTAEGALNEVHTMLNRMRDLAVQAANTGSNDASARAAAQTEIEQLTEEITRISDTTKFGAQKLLDGSFAGDFQVGADEGDTLTINIAAASAVSLGLATAGANPGDPDVIDIDVTTDAGAAITAIDAAIAQVSDTRGKLGAFQNRFESTIANLQVTTENLSASESRIRDTDMALEMVSFTRHQILLQAGTAMLGQANALPQGILRLLG